ncbi:hypothetical protein [uncultured Microscilla sp.]|uniref:hypothetical protein n=1 Tax=uncultured Microscilla sp. TaxID=432653 RepID=UPI00261B1352|nr:hypothetical protein [uncultured Microscilla sp.]
MKTYLFTILTLLGMYQITFGQGFANTFTGSDAGTKNTTGRYNTFTGYGAGYENTTGKNNTFLGSGAGIFNTKGSGNVCIGFGAGINMTGSNQLYIANSYDMPLIYGNFASKRVGIGTITPSEKFQVEGRMRLGGNKAGVWYETGATDWFVGRGESSNHFRFHYGDDKMTLTNDGKLGIGIGAPQASLHVNGTGKFAGQLTGTDALFSGELVSTNATFSGHLKANQVILNIGSFPDYVFAPQYTLMPLEQVEAYIQKHQHLPKVPAATQIIKEGMDVGQINVLLMEKVEELTLHTIAQHKQIKAVKASEQQLKGKVEALEQQLKEIHKEIKELLKKK